MKAANRRAATNNKRQPPTTAAARKRLWLFAQFLQTQNPEALAAEVTNFRETLYHAARIQVFFQRYSQALYARRAPR